MSFYDSDTEILGREAVARLLVTFILMVLSYLCRVQFRGSPGNMETSVAGAWGTRWDW